MEREIEIVEDAVARKGAVDVCRRVIALRKDRDVFGLGPIGQMSARIAMHKGSRVIGIDLVPERLQMAQSSGVDVIDIYGGMDNAEIAEIVRGMTDGRGADSVIDTVGMRHTGPLSRRPRSGSLDCCRTRSRSRSRCCRSSTRDCSSGWVRRT